MGAVGAPGNPVTREGGVLTKQSFSVSIGSGLTVAIITMAENPNGLYLWSLSVSSGAVADGSAPASSFLVEDVVQDGNMTQYLAVEIGLAQDEGQAFNSVEQDMKGILVPAGVALNLLNGGAGGTTALRRCSATAIVSVLS